MDNILVEKAIEASKRAYAQYSNFHVGAALLLENDLIVQGCNVENASYGLTNCAERTALFSAIAQGYKGFKKMAIYVDRKQFTAPCGACRQVLAELAPDIEIIMVNNKRQVLSKSIKELLPLAFNSEDLEN